MRNFEFLYGTLCRELSTGSLPPSALCCERREDGTQRHRAIERDLEPRQGETERPSRKNKYK